MQKKKIISLVWHQYLPALFGGQQTIAAFNNALSKETELICLCSKNNQADADLLYQLYPILPTSKWQFVNPLVWWRIYQFCKKEKPDYLLVEYCYHSIAAWFVKKFLGINIIHSSHNIEFERFKLLKKTYWKFVYLLEKWITQFSAINIYVTKEDKQKAIKFFNAGEEACVVIPHTISKKRVDKIYAVEKIRAQYQIPDFKSIFLFNGTLDYEPNAKAVIDIAEKLIPELNKINSDFVIIVTGRIEDNAYLSLFNFASNQLIITGKVDYIDNYFLAADVYINTVTKGCGVQTKTLEALSYNLNVICFESMLNGIKLNLAKEKVFIVSQNNWQQFAEKTWKSTNEFNNISNDFFDYYSYETHLRNLLHQL